jgi:hypothetical protein
MNIDASLPVRQISPDREIQLEKLDRMKPDYIFTQSEDLATAAVRDKQYHPLGMLGFEDKGNVFILRRNAGQ